MQKLIPIASLIAGTLLALPLTGCTGEDVFDALGSQVDPYAQKVNQMNDTGEQPTIQGENSPTTQAPAAQPAATAAPDQSAQSSAEPERSKEEHEYGEAVNIEFDNGTVIFATWTYDAQGEWAAMFGTYNGSVIYSYLDVEGNWHFETIDGRKVIHTDTSSAAQGEYGPSGLSSNWQDAQSGEWY